MPDVALSRIPAYNLRFLSLGVKFPRNQTFLITKFRTLIMLFTAVHVYIKHIVVDHNENVVFILMKSFFYTVFDLLNFSVKT